jgi:hypothetical protein
MNRTIVKTGQIPMDTDLTGAQRQTYVAMGKLFEAVFGQGPIVRGLPCVPTSPASMAVLVNPGEIYSLAQVDATAIGSLPADTTHSIVKQGLNLDPVTLSCPAPLTLGHSINYLVQVKFESADTTNVVRGYFNSAAPSIPWTGPGGGNAADATVREDKCTLAVKAGVSAATNTQTTPAPDAGYIGLYVVTVATGQTSILQGNIARLNGAPFVDNSLAVNNFASASAIQRQTHTYAADTGGINAYVVTLTPAPTAYTDGMKFSFRPINTNTGDATVNVNGLGAKQIKRNTAAALAPNDIWAGSYTTVTYSALLDQFLLDVISDSQIVHRFANETIDGEKRFVGGVTTFESTYTTLAFVDTNAALNEKRFVMEVSGGLLSWYTQTDDTSSTSPFMRVGRTGLTPTEVNFLSTTLKHGGSNVLTVANLGGTSNNFTVQQTFSNPSGAILVAADGASFNYPVRLRNNQINGSGQGLSLVWQMGTGGSTVDAAYLHAISTADWTISGNRSLALEFHTSQAGSITKRLIIGSPAVEVVNADLRVPVTRPSITDNSVALLRLVAASITTGTPIATDSGKRIKCSGGVTIPVNTFADGDTLVIYGNGTSRTITQGSGLTLIWADTGGTGNRTLSAYGTCVVTFNSATEAVISGNLT